MRNPSAFCNEQKKKNENLWKYTITFSFFFTSFLDINFFALHRSQPLLNWVFRLDSVLQKSFLQGLKVVLILHVFSSVVFFAILSYSILRLTIFIVRHLFNSFIFVVFFLMLFNQFIVWGMDDLTVNSMWNKSGEWNSNSSRGS